MDMCGRDDLFFTARDFGAEKWRSADVVTFFCSSLNFGRKTDMMTFKERVLFCAVKIYPTLLAWR